MSAHRHVCKTDHMYAAAVQRQQYFECIACSYSCCHSRGEFAHHGVCRENAYYSYDHIGVLHVIYDRVFTGRAFICSCLHHYSGSGSVSSERHYFRIRDIRRFELFDNRPADASALPVNYCNDHYAIHLPGLYL